jgi:uncharacterized membrane protein
VKYYTILIVVVLLISSLTAPTTLGAELGVTTKYSVTFHETGLPTGTNWSISMNGVVESSNNTTIVFLERDGSYSFIVEPVNGYSAYPKFFSVIVNGVDLNYSVTWSKTLYAVTFIESGLPSGTFWNVTFGGMMGTSSNSSIVFRVQNGTYYYIVPSINGIKSSIKNGSLTVSGNAANILVRFIFPVNYTFLEQGLPSKASWSVWINGTYHNSSSSVIVVTLPNGTYTYVVRLPSGYIATPIIGNVTWNNNLVLIRATSETIYYAVIAILFVVMLFFLFFYFWKVRKVKSKKNRRKGEDEKT